MQAIQPTQPIHADPQNRVRTFGRRVAVPFMLIATVLTFVGLAGSAARALGEAERLVARSYEDAGKAIDAARGASATIAHLRADRLLVRLTTHHDARVRLEDRMEERHRSLAADLDAIASRTRSVRVSHAAAAAQDAAAVWHQSMQADASGRDRMVELDRLAEVAETQVGWVADASARYGLGAERSAEAAVADQIGVIQALAGAALLLALLVVGALVLRPQRFTTALSAAVERLALGDAEGITASEAQALDGLLPPLAKLYDASRTVHGRSCATLLADGVAAARDAVIIVDADERIAYANASAAGLLGVRAEVLQEGAPASPLLAVLDLPTEAVTGHDTRLPDGRWLCASRSPLPDGGLLVILSDATERKRQDARAETTVNSLRTALNSMSQGLSLYDASHRLVVANRRYEEI